MFLANACARAHTHIPLHTYTCTHTHTCTHIHTHTHSHTRSHTRSHTLTHTHTPTHTHAFTHTHTHTHTHGGALTCGSLAQRCDREPDPLHLLGLKMKVGSRQEWLSGRSEGAESRTASTTPDALLQSEIDEQVCLLSIPLFCATRRRRVRRAWWLRSSCIRHSDRKRRGVGVSILLCVHEQAARQREMLAAKREENIRRREHQQREREAQEERAKSRNEQLEAKRQVPVKYEAYVVSLIMSRHFLLFLGRLFNE